MNKNVGGTLRENSLRVIDLFRQWDEDGNGKVSKKEFRRALPALGIHAQREEIDALFDSFDPDHSGSIEYKELSKLLRGPSKSAPSHANLAVEHRQTPLADV